MNKLKQFGINTVEEKVYLALAEFGSMNGAEVARKAKVPTSKVYNALENLVNLEIVISSKDRHVVYSAVKPEIALNTLIKIRQHTLEIQRAHTLQAIKMQTPEVEERNNVDVFFSRENRYSLLLNLIENSTNEIIVYSSGLTNNAIVIQGILRAKKRGVNVKFLAYDEPSPMLKNIALKNCEPLEDYSFLVIDARDVLQVVKNAQNRTKDVNLIISNNGMAKVFRNYFYETWKKSKTK